MIAATHSIIASSRWWMRTTIVSSHGRRSWMDQRGLRLMDCWQTHNARHWSNWLMWVKISKKRTRLTHLGPEQNGQHFVDNIFKQIEDLSIFIKNKKKLKISFAKWWSFCVCLSMLTSYSIWDLATSWSTLVQGRAGRHVITWTNANL